MFEEELLCSTEETKEETDMLMSVVVVVSKVDMCGRVGEKGMFGASQEAEQG